MPKRRDEIHKRWFFMQRDFAWLMYRYVGGAQLEVPHFELGAGDLVLVNHQALLDIPVFAEALRHTVPCIVTRRRYAHGIPLVSQILRAHDMPLVEPRDPIAPQLEMLRRVGREEDRPIVIFPEGRRTRDGRIRLFRAPGLKAILAGRKWQVYCFVLDGLTQVANLPEFARRLSSVKLDFEVLGPFEFDSTDESEMETFITDMHDRMCVRLEEMRGHNPAKTETETQ